VVVAVEKATGDVDAEVEVVEVEGAAEVDAVQGSVVVEVVV
jgi:hypothetical protein